MSETSIKGMSPEALNAVIESFEHRLEQAKAGRPEAYRGDCPACQWWGQSSCVADCEDEDGITRFCPCAGHCHQYYEWFEQWNDGKLSIEDFIAFLTVRLYGPGGLCLIERERGFVEELIDEVSEGDFTDLMEKRIVRIESQFRILRGLTTARWRNLPNHQNNYNAVLRHLQEELEKMKITEEKMIVEKGRPKTDREIAWIETKRID